MSTAKLAAGPTITVMETTDGARLGLGPMVVELTRDEIGSLIAKLARTKAARQARAER